MLEAGAAQEVGGQLGRAADVGRVVGLGRDRRDAQPVEEVGEDALALAVDPPGQPRRPIHRPHATGPSPGAIGTWRATSTTSGPAWSPSPRSWPTWPSTACGQSVAAGAEKASDEERLITRARRSVEKAAVLLGQVDEPGE